MFVVADPCSVLLVLMLMCVCMLNVLQPEQQSECESIKWEGGLSGWWVGAHRHQELQERCIASV